MEIIANQKKSLGTLLEIIDPIKGETDFTDIYIGLVDLAKIYENVGETLTDEQLKDIINTIDPLRESIV
jgi:Ca2+-binding EF-hand superfamily protein